jgi:hypothetical protein
VGKVLLKKKKKLLKKKKKKGEEHPIVKSNEPSKRKYLPTTKDLN